MSVTRIKKKIFQFVAGVGIMLVFVLSAAHLAAVAVARSKRIEMTQMKKDNEWNDACPCAGCKRSLTNDHYRFPVGDGDFLCEDCYALENGASVATSGEAI